MKLLKQSASRKPTEEAKPFRAMVLKKSMGRQSQVGNQMADLRSKRMRSTSSGSDAVTGKVVSSHDSGSEAWEVDPSRNLKARHAKVSCDFDTGAG